MTRKRGLALCSISARCFVFACMIAGGITTAYAEPAPILWTAEHNKTIASGNAERGRTLTEKCDRCHGTNGVSEESDMPHLAGQNARYLYKQLQDLKSDARDGGGMNRRARHLSDQNMADLAIWYAGLTLPPMEGAREVPPAPVLVTKGDLERNIPPCAACHGVDGMGLSKEYDAPVLAGMPYDYFVKTMQDFVDGTRTNDIGGVVRQFASSITEDELEELAEYYLALGKRLRAPIQ